MKPIRLDRLVLVVLAVLIGSSAGARAESLASIFTNAQTQAAGPRPCIIFIRCHGLGYGDLSCYGQTNYETPNLDRLAAGGMRFTNFHPGSPEFSTALAALMTGKNGGPVAGTATLVERLQQAHYHTGLIGEWTLGAQPWQQGFDEFLGFLGEDEGRDYFADHFWRYAPSSLSNPANHAPPAFVGKEMLYANEGGNKGKYLPDLLVTMVINYARVHQPQKYSDNQPFFLLADFAAPRSTKAGADVFTVPSDAPFSEEPWPQAAKNRAALISRLDEGIGRLFEQLHKLKLTNNVAIFFSSSAAPEKFADTNLDFLKPNGELTGDPAAAPAPMIAYWPGVIPAGRVSDAAWSGVDFMPTVLEMAGANPAPDLDGVSILPVLTGQAEAPH